MSAEALLGQNVALIYDFIKQAVAYRGRGEHWEAINMLDIAASLMYLDEEKAKALTDLSESITKLRESASRINHSTPEAAQDARAEYLNREASRQFSEHLKAIRNYMQGAGYYKMMNKDWSNFFDPSKGRISGDKQSANLDRTVKRR